MDVPTNTTPGSIDGSNAGTSSATGGSARSARRDTAVRWLRRTLVVAVWLGAVWAWRRYQADTGLGATATAQEFVDTVEAAWWGVLAYVAVYLARPIVLFPAAILTVVGGVLFGPVLGVIVVVVAANASAMIAYGVGRSIGRPPGADTGDARNLLARWSGRLRSNGFETVLVMRLVFLPYDLVNYACGFLRIPARSFLLGTALGSLPGTVAFVLIGASLERVDQGIGGLDPLVLAAGVAIFVVSIAASRLLRRRPTADVSTTARATTTGTAAP